MWWHEYLKIKKKNKNKKTKNQFIYFHFRNNYWLVQISNFTSILLLALMEPSDAAILALTGIFRREREAPKVCMYVEFEMSIQKEWVSEVII